MSKPKQQPSESAKPFKLTAGEFSGDRRLEQHDRCRAALDQL